MTLGPSSSNAGTPYQFRASEGMHSDEVIPWLRASFERLDKAARPSEIRVAFAPIILNPNSEPLAQVGAAIRRGSHPQLPSSPQLVDAICTYLDKDEIYLDQDGMFLENLWYLLSAFPLGTWVTPIGRHFLVRLEGKFTIEPTLKRPLVRAVANAVSVSTPATSAQVAFFDYLQRVPDYWDIAFVRVAIDIAFKKAEVDREQGVLGAYRPDQVWDELKTRLGAEMLEALQGGGGGATALAESIARHRHQPSLGADRLAAEIERARAPVREDGRSHSPYVTFQSQKSDDEARKLLAEACA